LGHLLHNGLQIIIIYFGGSNAAVKTSMDNNNMPAYVMIAGAAIFCGALWLLIKNRTPLPRNWTNDYNEDELAENKI